MAIIYLITNQNNGKKYVGQTKRTAVARYCQHIESAFRIGENKRNCFYREIAESGEMALSVFKFDIIEECKDEIKYEREMYWIERLNCEYNEQQKESYIRSRWEEKDDEIFRLKVTQNDHCLHVREVKVASYVVEPISLQTSYQIPYSLRNTNCNIDDIERVMLKDCVRELCDTVVENRLYSIDFVDYDPISMAKQCIIELKIYPPCRQEHER